jgi:putative tryptophan/tyrosine transport system substrate-binding protein
MRRREFIAGLGGAAVWPAAGSAQQSENRIGFLPVGSPSNPYDRSLVDAFRAGLREQGIVENRDIVLDTSWVTDEPELPQLVSGLVRRGARMLVTVGTSSSVAAKQQVSTIPIVFINVGNPTGAGLVESLARPGGNATGFSDMHADLSGKFVQLASELGKPAIGYLWYTGFADGPYRLEVTQRAAKSLGVNLRSRGIGDIAEADNAMVSIKADGAIALIVQSSPFAFRHRQRLIDTATQHGLGTVLPFPPAAKDGALIAYGPDYADLYHQAATYVARILKGAVPADLPVQQPTKFELVINLKTAKAIGLQVPPQLLARADEVIE